MFHFSFYLYPIFFVLWNHKQYNSAFVHFWIPKNKTNNVLGTPSSDPADALMADATDAADVLSTDVLMLLMC